MIDIGFGLSFIGWVITWAITREDAGVPRNVVLLLMTNCIG